MPEFSTRPVTVTVPATSANLGPGFDSFGLALGRFDQVHAQVQPTGLDVQVTGIGADTVPRDERHLLVRAARAAFDRLGGQPPGLSVHCRNQIPHGRGLGSSAAAIVAGIEIARGLVTDGPERLDDAAALALASELEGHPDNVAACLLGGLTIAWIADGRAQAVRVEPSGVRAVVFIPTTESATHAARAALPDTIPHADAAFNASRAALLVLALTGHPELLLTATEDRLHQSYRAAGMPDSASLTAALRDHGVPAVISGAGSTVLALVGTAAELSAAEALVPQGWEYVELPLSDGARRLPG